MCFCFCFCFFVFVYLGNANAHYKKSLQDNEQLRKLWERGVPNTTIAKNQRREGNKLFS
jgi:hypothetical protein